MKFLRSKPKQPTLSDLELALLKSLREEPNLWQITENQKPGDLPVLISRNREKGVVIESRVTWNSMGGKLEGTAWAHHFKFGVDFGHAWHAEVDALWRDREAKRIAGEAEATRLELMKRMGV